MNLSQFKPFKIVLVLRRFDLRPNIRERNPVVKRDPTLCVCVRACVRARNRVRLCRLMLLVPVSKK
jgi:hypothetical protein